MWRSVTQGWCKRCSVVQGWCTRCSVVQGWCKRCSVVQGWYKRIELGCIVVWRGRFLWVGEGFYQALPNLKYHMNDIHAIWKKSPSWHTSITKKILKQDICWNNYFETVTMVTFNNIFGCKQIFIFWCSTHIAWK